VSEAIHGLKWAVALGWLAMHTLTHQQPNIARRYYLGQWAEEPANKTTATRAVVEVAGRPKMISFIEALRFFGEALPSAGIGLLILGMGRTCLLLIRTCLWTRALRRCGVSERQIQRLFVEAAQRDLLAKGKFKQPSG
jgi:hypothetical protein